MWELERYMVTGWGAPSLPMDGAKKMKWCAIEDGDYVRHPLVHPDAKKDDCAASEVPPVEKVEFAGQLRKCKWCIQPEDSVTDDLGWQYGNIFSDSGGSWKNRMHSYSTVRRRRWIPTFYQDEEVALPPRKHSTWLGQKGLPRKQVLLEVALGTISLHTLAEQFEAENWELAGGLMAKYFEAIEATNMDVESWATGEAVRSIQGKVRSLSAKIPLPRQPMCPPFSRIQMTWHAGQPDENRLVLEQLSMALDVPCGTCFNTLICDTFTVKDGVTQMVRTWAVEWLQSTWLKSAIENGAPGELVKKGELFAKLITEWAAENAK